MLTTSALYKSILANPAHRIEWKIENGAEVILSDRIVSGSIEGSIFEDLGIGNAISGRLVLKLRDVTLSPSSPLLLYFRAALEDSASEWIQRGVYYIDTIKTQPYSSDVDVEAFDSMLKAEAVYLKQGEWTPRTVLSIVNAIAAEMGVGIESYTLELLEHRPYSISDAPNMGEDGTTKREMLSYIAVIYGGNWIIDASGDLKLIPLTYYQLKTPIDIGNDIVTFSKSDPEEIKRVILWQSSNSYYRAPAGLSDDAWEAVGGRCITANLPLEASQELANWLLAFFAEAEAYCPYEAGEAYLNPAAELGDAITIKDVTSGIFSQVLEVGPLAASDLSARGEEVKTSLYPYASSTEKSIINNITTLDGSIEGRAQALVDAETGAREASETKILEQTSALRTDVDSVTSTVRQMTEEGGVITTLQTRVKETADGLEVVTQKTDKAEEYINEQETYLKWDGVNAVLSVGKSDAPVHTEMRSNAFAVVKNGAEVLLADEDGVAGEAFKANTSVQAGDYKWVDEGSNGFSLIYVG